MEERNHATNDGDRGAVCIVRFGQGHAGTRREAEALVESGYNVQLVCRRGEDEPAHEAADGVEIHRLSVGRPGAAEGPGSAGRYLLDLGLFFVLAFAKVLVLDIKRGFRAIQVDGPPDCLVFAALVPKLAGAKVVLRLQEPMPELFGERIENRLWRLLVAPVRWTTKPSLKLADAVLTATREMRDYLGRQGADLGKTTVIIHLPDERVVGLKRHDQSAQRVAQLKKEERRAGRFRAVYHGPIEEQRGVDVIVRATAKLKDDIPGIEFVYSGKGTFAENIEALTRKLGVEQHVTYRGDPRFDDLIEGILTADVAVVPDKRNPRSILVHPDFLYESIGLQKPVVASRLDSVAAYFPEDSIVFFEPGDDADLADKLKYVFAHPGEMSERVGLCWQIYETHRWEREKRKYLNVYDALLAS